MHAQDYVNDSMQADIPAICNHLQLIRSRLTDSLCPGVALRPQLEAARAKLSTLLCNTVEKAGANSSYLLIGARGTGKSLGETFGRFQMNLTSMDSWSSYGLGYITG